MPLDTSKEPGKYVK